MKTQAWKYENIPGKDNHGNAHHLHRIADATTNIMVVCMEQTYPGNCPEARLIAAAPELLGMLRLVAERLNMEEQEEPGGSYILAGWREEINALLRKATGQQG